MNIVKKRLGIEVINLSEYILPNCINIMYNKDEYDSIIISYHNS